MEMIWPIQTTRKPAIPVGLLSFEGDELIIMISFPFLCNFPPGRKNIKY
jgi:hypothetical protein